MNFDSLVNNIHSVQELFQAQAAHAVNHALTARNWLIGYNIVEFEQNGEDRAAYGQKLLKNLELSLKTKGLTERRFREFRRLYQTYPQLAQPILEYISDNVEIRRLPIAEFQSADNEQLIIPGNRLFNHLSSTHLTMISVIDDPLKRLFYEIETINGCWSVAELDRQISSLYYERSGLSKNKEALSALEEALIDHLQEFLLEMGRGFCFEARQKRILIDNDYFKADLVFYHRILKCHVIVDCKIDRFRHEHASQLNTYINYYKHEVMQPDDNPPIGILLCTEKGDTLVKYATAGLDQSIFVQKYMIQLPSCPLHCTYLNRSWQAPERTSASGDHLQPPLHSRNAIRERECRSDYATLPPREIHRASECALQYPQRPIASRGEANLVSPRGF